MADIRLLAPACFAWLAAWLAVTAPDAGMPAWAMAVACWAAAVVVLVVLVVALRAGSAEPGESTGRRHALPRVAATALAVLAAGAMVATAAAAALEARASSPLAAASDEYRTARVVMELTG